jgi:hypothetical protein
MALRKTWPKWLLLGVVGAGGWYGYHRLFDEDQATRNLVNQVWIERMPRDQRDMVHVGAIVQREGRRLGGVARASQWRQHQDLFVWQLDKDLLRVRFPQSNELYSFHVRTWDCEGEAPKPFQLCLELKRGDRVLRFFSQKDWVIRPRAEGPVAPEIAALVPSWEATMDTVKDEPVGEGESSGPSPFEAP